MVARSSVKTEYQAMPHTAGELMWIKVRNPMVMHYDNQVVAHIASNPIFDGQTKQIKVDCHFIREAIM